MDAEGQAGSPAGGRGMWLQGRSLSSASGTHRAVSLGLWVWKHPHLCGFPWGRGRCPGAPSTRAHPLGSSGAALVPVPSSGAAAGR